MPAFPPRPCLDCGKVTTNGSRCQPHQAELLRRRSAARGGATAQGYTYRWQQARAEAIRRQPWCSTCGATTDLTGDHITPKSRGGGIDPVNIQVLCRSCNSRKGGKI